MKAIHIHNKFSTYLFNYPSVFFSFHSNRLATKERDSAKFIPFFTLDIEFRVQSNYKQLNSTINPSNFHIFIKNKSDCI